MSKDYSDLGLNNQLLSENSLSMRRSNRRLPFQHMDNIAFEGLFDVTSGRVNASKINIAEFIRVATGSSASGTFSSATLNLTSTLTYKAPNAGDPIMGNVYVGVYEGSGTAAADQIYPIKGANVTAGRYIVEAWYDHQTWDEISSKWRGKITDTQGTSTQDITFAAHWFYIDYKSTAAA